jgi:hypothetical protein
MSGSRCRRQDRPGQGTQRHRWHPAVIARPQPAHTWRAYAPDWQVFVAWYAAAGQPALSARI